MPSKDGLSKSSSKSPHPDLHLDCEKCGLTRFSTAPQNRHPERSASQIRRIKKGLGRGVEGPRRCLLADALLGFPTTNIGGKSKSHNLRPERLARWSDLLFFSFSQTINPFRTKAFVPGINPRPTLKASFYAACLAAIRGGPDLAFET